MQTLLRVCAVIFAAMALSAQAQAPAGPNSPSPGMGGNQAQQAQARYTAIQNQLDQIQSNALESNPELAEQQSELESSIMSAMIENGATPEADFARMQEIQQEVQANSGTAQERQAMIAEYQSLRRGLAQAQQQAMQNEDIAQQQQAFTESLIAAMNEVNPETQQLIAEMRQIQQQMMGGGMQQGQTP